MNPSVQKSGYQILGACSRQSQMEHLVFFDPIIPSRLLLEQVGWGELF